jgi:hypothetical protein
MTPFVSGMTDDLGHRHDDLALGGLDPLGAVTVAGTRGIGGPLIARAPEEDGHLVLDRPLEDELGTQATEGGEGIGITEAAGEHRLDGSLDLDAGGHSVVHGVVSICGSATSALEPRRLHFSSGLRTPPAPAASRCGIGARVSSSCGSVVGLIIVLVAAGAPGAKPAALALLLA